MNIVSGRSGYFGPITCFSHLVGGLDDNVIVLIIAALIIIIIIYLIFLEEEESFMECTFFI